MQAVYWNYAHTPKRTKADEDEMAKYIKKSQHVDHQNAWKYATNGKSANKEQRTWILW